MLKQRSDDCGRQVQQAKNGEILGSRIGTKLHSTVACLRNGVGTTYRKVPEVIEELYDVILAML